jgi:hypothetical protein
MIKTVEYKLPVHLACALINGDRSGMSDEEERQLDEWVSDKVAQHGGLFHCVDVSQNCEFCWLHDYDKLGADCAIFTFYAKEV